MCIWTFVLRWRQRTEGWKVFISPTPNCFNQFVLQCFKLEILTLKIKTSSFHWSTLVVLTDLRFKHCCGLMMMCSHAMVYRTSIFYFIFIFCKIYLRYLIFKNIHLNGPLLNLYQYIIIKNGMHKWTFSCIEIKIFIPTCSRFIFTVRLSKATTNMR